MTPATAILVPVLNRPQNVRPLIESIEAATPEPHRTVFLASPVDPAEHEAIQAARGTVLTVEEPGTWARKINAGFRAMDEPFVFLAADDLRFHDGWLSEALRLATPRPLDGYKGADVVGTNDLGNPRTMDPVNPSPHSTHSLVRRSYVDALGGTMDQGPGVVLFEGYAHEYADDELVETAKTRGVYVHAYDSHVEHLHPDYGKAAYDDTYAWGRRMTRESRRLFQERATTLGFGTGAHHALRRSPSEMGRRARG